MSTDFGKQMYLDLGDDFKETLDNTYTNKIKIIQYTPSKSESPEIYQLIDKQKMSILLNEIVNSNISEEEKKFLKFAAMRHLVFNYSLIAEYYCHATPEMQKLMEKSGLVIIDFEDAIENGYVKLSENIRKIVESEGLEENE